MTFFFSCVRWEMNGGERCAWRGSGHLTSHDTINRPVLSSVHIGSKPVSDDRVSL